MNNKIKFEGIIVVEGKDDKTALKRVLDANIFVLNGMTGINQKKIDDLKELSKKNNIYILTDPDFAGKKIRQKLSQHIDNSINIYVSRDKANKNNNIGVENLKDEDIISIFKNIKQYSKNSEEKYIFSMEDLIEKGLNARQDSRQKREVLGDILSIGYCNAKQLLIKLNSINISKEEYEKALEKMNVMLETKDKNAAIFGKFFPIHKGHANFIKYISKFCKNLYVFVCEETQRDEMINSKSKLPNMTIKDREYFVKKELKSYKNIHVKTLNEDGIETYPNGWENWSKRVIEKLKSENIQIDVFFTNEIQDKENYEKYFNKKAYLTDPNRNMFDVSATKIREETEKYLEYMVDSVKEFIEKNKTT